MIIPEFVLETMEKLKKHGYEGYLVGGCVRDLLMGRTPQDWDVTTNARPEEIVKVFENAKYENEFGTVLVPTHNENNDVIEITTYRSEQGYADRRHPDAVRFETELDKDLERRDFTINALAMDAGGKITDLFGGQKDIKAKIIRAVGEPAERFKEDALRLMRAVRFSCQLGFAIEPKTERAIVKLAGGLKFISNERLRDELIKILQSDQPAEGISRLQEDKLLQYIIPELEQGINVNQYYHHTHPVYKHNLLSLKYCPSQAWQVRLAALLHDIGKPKSLSIVDGHPAFYNHQYIGAKMTDKIMRRLKFSNEDLLRVVNLVKNHMFYYSVGEVSPASVRRLIVKTGRENLRDLIDIRIADRLGSGLKEGLPYKLRHLQYMMEKVQHDPVSVKMLKINGNDLMKVLNIPPGPKIGAILEVILGEVVEDPALNDKDYLEKRCRELDKMNLAELKEHAEKIVAEKQAQDDRELKKDFGV